MRKKKEKSFLPKKNSLRIVMAVISLHLLLLFIFSGKDKQKIYQPSKPLVVHHFTEKVLKPKPAPVKVIAKKKMLTNPLPQKDVVKKLVKKESITSSTLLLIKKLEDDLTHLKSDGSNLGAKDLIVPKKIEEMKSFAKIEEGSNSMEKTRLVEELQHQLHLPEYGETKCAFHIDEKGQICSLDFLSSKSAKNLAYLKKTLPELSFPWFNQQQPNQTRLVITFKNESE